MFFTIRRDLLARVVVVTSAVIVVSLHVFLPCRSPGSCRRLTVVVAGPGTTRLIVIATAIAALGLFALLDELFVRIDGQLPRAYRRSHNIAVPRALYVAVFATMAAIMFLVVRLSSAG